MENELASNQAVVDAMAKVIGGMTEEAPPVVAPEDPAAKPPADPAAPTEAPATTDPVVTETPIVPTTGFDEPQFIEQHFKEFGIESIEDAKEIIKNFDTVYAEHEALKIEHEKLKNAPQFTDENDKKIFDFVKAYGQHDKRGRLDYIEIDTTDPNTVSEDEAIRLAFVLSKKNLSVEDANKLFNSRIKPQFSVTEEMDDEEKDLVRIAKSEAADEARQKLRDLKAQYGQKPKVETATPEQKAADAVIERGMADQTRAWEDAVAKTTVFTIKTAVAGEQKIEIGENERKAVDAVLRPLVLNKANYDSNGHFKGDIQKLINTQLQAIAFQKALDKVDLEAGNKGREEGFRTVSSRKPEGIATPPAAGGEPSVLQQQGQAILAKFGR